MLEKDLLYIPHKKKQSKEGGSFYWFYKAVRKHLAQAGIIEEHIDAIQEDTHVDPNEHNSE